MKLMLQKCGPSLFVFLLFSSVSLAQTETTASDLQWSEKIAKAPEDVFEKFEKAGMQPSVHILTSEERRLVLEAFSILPPLHKQVLMTHLSSVSFMDNMPNTALTSKISNAGESTRFNITFRAGILQETISEWATWKENSYYEPVSEGSYRLNIMAGDLNAIQYVMLHEATHIVDATSDCTRAQLSPNTIKTELLSTEQVWEQANKPKVEYIDSVLAQSRFRGGKRNPISFAPEIYQSLKKTPFVSLYATAARSEDIAELTTIYHLTQMMGQPYRLSISKNGTEIASFEPMKNQLVKERLEELKKFY